MSNKKPFKDTGNFPLIIILRNALDGLSEILKCFMHKFREICGQNQKSLSFKFPEIWSI